MQPTLKSKQDCFRGAKTSQKVELQIKKSCSRNVQDCLRGAKTSQKVGLQIKKSCSLRSTDFFGTLPKASFGRGHKKIPYSVQDFFICAQNRNRTCTPLREPDFESDASTSSAIWASKSGCNITDSLPCLLIFLKGIPLQHPTEDA